MQSEQVKINFDALMTHRLTTEERAIIGLLQRGRENAIQSKEISRLTGLSDVEIRQTVRHLILEHNLLIASSVSNQKGFYLVSNENEIREATRSLRHRGIMILVRAAKLQKLSVEDVFGQARMEFKT